MILRGEKMAHNRKSIIAGIRNLLKRNYGFAGDEIDLEAIVDDQLTFGENWHQVKIKVIEREIPITEI